MKLQIAKAAGYFAFAALHLWHGGALPGFGYGFACCGAVLWGTDAAMAVWRAATQSAPQGPTLR